MKNGQFRERTKYIFFKVAYALPGGGEGGILSLLVLKLPVVNTWMGIVFFNERKF